MVVLVADGLGYVAILAVLGWARRRLPAGDMPVRQKWTSRLVQMNRDLWLAGHLYLSTVLAFGFGWYSWTIDGDRILRAEVVAPIGFVACITAGVALSLLDQIRLLRQQDMEVRS
jgi:hypothetical protein